MRYSVNSGVPGLNPSGRHPLHPPKETPEGCNWLDLLCNWLDSDPVCYAYFPSFLVSGPMDIISKFFFSQGGCRSGAWHRNGHLFSSVDWSHTLRCFCALMEGALTSKYVHKYTETPESLQEGWPQGKHLPSVILCHACLACRIRSILSSFLMPRQVE